MKKILFSAVLAFATLQTANAQLPQRSFDGKAIAEKMVQRMDRVLDLNDSQEKELLKIYTDIYTQKKEGTTSAADRKAQREEFAKQIKQVLTEEQQKTWAAAKQKQMKQARSQQQNLLHKSLSPEKMVEKMDKELDLTEAQKKQMLEVYKDIFSQKVSDRRAGRSQFSKKMKEILTETQLKKWEELKAEQMAQRKYDKNKSKK